VSALSLSSVRPQLQQKSLALLRVQGWPLARTLFVVRHEEKYVFRALAEFLSILRGQMQARIA
jgi:hypothetical protein